MTEPPYRRFTGWPTREYVWAVSPWDHRAHAHHRLGDVVSEAVCEHRCRTSTLIDDDGTVPECLGCLKVIGSEMPDLFQLEAHWEQWWQQQQGGG
jgi:hypothetical protein